MKKKEIRCLGHGPLQNYLNAQVPWEDVWLQYKIGRIKKFAGPCLISYQSLEFDIETQKFGIETSEPKDRYIFEEALAEYEGIKRQLESQSFVITNLDSSSGPTIYTKAAVIDRKEAERMCTALLEVLGVKGTFKFRWSRSKYVVCPTG